MFTRCCTRTGDSTKRHNGLQPATFQCRSVSQLSPLAHVPLLIDVGFRTICRRIRILTPNSVAALTNRLHRLSLGSPLLFAQQAAPGTKNTPGGNDDPLLTMLHKGSLYAYSQSNNPSAAGYGEYAGQVESTRMNGDAVGGTDSYIDINGVTQKIALSGSGGGTVIGPQLHLLLFLKSPIISPPTKRMPLKVASTNGVVSDSTEHLVANIATFGRNNVHVMLWSDQICDFRIGAIRVSGISSVGAAGLPQEEPFDVVKAVAANTRTVLSSCNQDGVYADWINIYATPPTQIPLTNINFFVSAYD